jgi:hypothetical protein
MTKFMKTMPCSKSGEKLRPKKEFACVATAPNVIHKIKTGDSTNRIQRSVIVALFVLEAGKKSQAIAILLRGVRKFASCEN